VPDAAGLGDTEAVPRGTPESLRHPAQSSHDIEVGIIGTGFSGLGHNSQIHMIESQLNYVLDALRAMRRRGAEVAEVREEAQERFNDELHAALQGTVWTAGHCHSWYLDDTGRNTTLWPSWTFRFRQRTRSFDPEAYVLSNGARG
jgi:hypothetical protein